MIRRTGKRAAAVLGVTVLAVALAGCGTPASPPTSTSSPTSIQSDAPTPHETRTTNPDADPDDPRTWTITEQGMGPVQLDELFADAVAGVPTWTVDENCSWTAFWNDPEKSVSAYFSRESDLTDGAVTTIDVSTSETAQPGDGPRTADGLGLGSSREEVLVAHPDAVEQKPTIGDGSMLRVGPDGIGSIFFSFRADEDAVSAVTVTSRDEPPYEVCG
ncbi:hypothetical protein L2X99_07395 [Microbacterium sp. KUDC0406]|uniref:hypothetical protein n=1 Tax=Microbacterium sp. KUDC0406 TaxID=2909588 RepID=UPI001F2FCBE8|nr:hypothetical protein [Microbacterium sp. KUDC0406]UJP11336.1 hypothetical protein L2X99_07395 [Microbacterium sp. KUDC0406]